MRIVLPLVGLAFIALAGMALLFFQQGLQDYQYANSLRSVSVSAPEGWVTADYTSADGAVITGTTDNPDAATGSTTDNILGAFAAAADDKDAAVHLFENGEEKIALRMTLAPLVKSSTALGDRLGKASAKAEAEIDPDTIIGTQSGVAFIEAPRWSYQADATKPTPVNYRLINATVGDKKVTETVEIAILTNSSDAAVASVIESLDIAAANDKRSVPEDTIIVDAGFETRRPQPLSQMPPPPTVAYKAMGMLRSNAELDPLSEEVLERVRDGDIIDFETLHAAYPDIHGLSVDVIELFQLGQPSVSARYNADLLANGGQDWSNQEYYVLSVVSQPGTSQATLSEFLSEGHEIAPEILALVQMLPEMSGSNETAGGSSSAVLGSGDCTVQGGVRRCVIDGN